MEIAEAKSRLYRESFGPQRYAEDIAYIANYVRPSNQDLLATNITTKSILALSSLSFLISNHRINRNKSETLYKLVRSISFIILRSKFL